MASPIYLVLKLSLVDKYQSLRCLQNCIEVYFLILAFEIILQILGFSQVQKYDSWITNKHLYPINLGARRKCAVCCELLVYDNFKQHGYFQLSRVNKSNKSMMKALHIRYNFVLLIPGLISLVHVYSIFFGSTPVYQIFIFSILVKSTFNRLLYFFDLIRETNPHTLEEIMLIW